VKVEANRVAAALDDVARHGRFFAIRSRDDTAEIERFFPFSRLDDPEARLAREQAMERLAVGFGVTELRPVASLLQMSVAAQLGSAPLATAAAHGLVPQFEAEQLRYGFAPSGAIRVVLDGNPSGLRGPTDRLVAALARSVSAGPLAAFTAALGASVALSPLTTCGNVASTLAAGAQVLRRTPDGEAMGDRALDLVVGVLETAPLSGTGHFVPAAGGPMGERTFRRNNCCLFYRIPGGGTCGDCVLPAAA
jgi:hypothetical protein